jgi:hypothetical protein
MAKKKSGEETKAPEKSSSKGGAKAASKAAPAAEAKAGAPKAAAKKGAEAPVKLTPTQGELLKKIGGSEAGYLAEKKAEQRTIDALLERKLIKKGAKDKASGNVNYMISNAGKKHPSFQTGGA